MTRRTESTPARPLPGRLLSCSARCGAGACLQRIALVGGPRLVGAGTGAVSGARFSRIAQLGSTRLRRRTDTPRAYVEPVDRRTSARFCVSSSTSSVVGGAGLLHSPDVAEVGRGQDRHAVAEGRTAAGARSGEAVASAAATSCLLSLNAAALSKRPSPRLDDRARRSNRQCFRRCAAAPAQVQASEAGARRDCISSRARDGRAIAKAT